LIKLVASLGLLFKEVPLLERFGRAAAAGFSVVEMWTPFDLPLDKLVRAKEKAGVSLLQFNLDMGDVPAGERGFLSLPDQKERFRSGFDLALKYARQLNVRQLHCLTGNRLPGFSRKDQLTCLRDNLEWLVPRLETNDLYLNIEPLNAFESPDYLISRPSNLFAILRGLDLPRVGVLYDLYHAQLMEGNLVSTLRENLALVGHIQVADVPDRHQPGTGEINFPFVFSEIEAVGYEGFVSLEYIPIGSTEESLAWLPRESRVTIELPDLAFGSSALC